MSTTKDDPRLRRISAVIRAIPDFPKPGIMFRDVTTLLLDHQAFKDTIDILAKRYRDQKIDVVAGYNGTILRAGRKLKSYGGFSGGVVTNFQVEGEFDAAPVGFAVAIICTLHKLYCHPTTSQNTSQELAGITVVIM